MNDEDKARAPYYKGGGGGGGGANIHSPNAYIEFTQKLSSNTVLHKVSLTYKRPITSFLQFG